MFNQAVDRQLSAWKDSHTSGHLQETNQRYLTVPERPAQQAQNNANAQQCDHFDLDLDLTLTVSQPLFGKTLAAMRWQ